MKFRPSPTDLALGALWVGLIIAMLGHRTEHPPANPGPNETDPVAASFERELNREPGPAARVRRDDIDDDVLYQTINPVSWTADAGRSGKLWRELPEECRRLDTGSLSPGTLRECRQAP